MRFFVVTLTLLLGLLRAGDAFACMNATMSETEAVRKLKEAETALEEGDVVSARELAAEVHGIFEWRYRESPLYARSARIGALAYVRDPKASEGELAGAVVTLRRVVEPTGDLPSQATPVVLADFGEALERTRDVDGAFDTLAPLADKDLIGSAYAYAALSRAAKAKGDTTRATLAMTRCETMAVNPGACRGEYPKRPFLRARPIDLSASALLFLGVALVRLARKKQPWSAFRARRMAGIAAAAGVGAFLLANDRMGWAAMAAAMPLLFLGPMQRSQWLTAVRRGNVAGFEIRREDEDDERNRAEVVVRTIDPSYRESAKPPIVYRWPTGPSPHRRLVFGAVLLAVFVGCAIVLLSLTSRG